jgi:signal recognition particle subunit SRP54
MPEFDEEEMQRKEERFRKSEFTLEDLRKQLSQIGRLGPLQKVIGLIPGMSALNETMGDVDPEEDMKRQFGIINAMTPDERRNPRKIIDLNRRLRIAAGAGVQPREVNDLVMQFDAMSKMLKSLAENGLHERWIRRNYPL